MRFLADMGVAGRVVVWLRERGDDVVHLAERGLQRLPNGEIFVLAADESRIVLTFDLDFGEIVASSGDQTVSVIVFRLNNASTEFVIRRLEATLAVVEDALARGAIVVVEDGRHRVRHLPIGG